MSTATLEAPVQAAPVWKMPEAKLGMYVMHYPDNGSNEAAGVVSKIIGIDREMLHLELGGSHEYPSHYLTHKDQVRHRDDPRLKVGNAYILQKGCWDYTPWEKQLRARLSELEATVAKLVNDLGGPSNKSKKSE